MSIDRKRRDNTLYTDFELVANVEGADVFVDDVFYGVTPFHKRIPYGKHNFVLKAAALFSKFAIAIGVLLGIGVLGGGSSYVGTFTDRNGNSYDVYKKN